MPSLFKKTIEKEVAINTIANELKRLNLTANFKDANWWVLNKNAEVMITDVAINEYAKPTAKGTHFLEIYYQTFTSNKNIRVFIPLFETGIKKRLDHILNCDLTEFEVVKRTKKSASNENAEEVNELSTQEEQTKTNLETNNQTTLNNSSNNFNY